MIFLKIPGVRRIAYFFAIHMMSCKGSRFSKLKLTIEIYLIVESSVSFQTCAIMQRIDRTVTKLVKVSV